MLGGFLRYRALTGGTKPIVIASRAAAWRSSPEALDCRVGFASSQ